MIPNIRTITVSNAALRIFLLYYYLFMTPISIPGYAVFQPELCQFILVLNGISQINVVYCDSKFLIHRVHKGPTLFVIRIVCNWGPHCINLIGSGAPLGPFVLSSCYTELFPVHGKQFLAAFELGMNYFSCFHQLSVFRYSLCYFLTHSFTWDFTLFFGTPKARSQPMYREDDLFLASASAFTLPSIFKCPRTYSKYSLLCSPSLYSSFRPVQMLL